jgi:Holliday junction resolvase
MLKRTISEVQFVAFCQHRGIPLERIPESDTRTPDYQITAGSERLIVEIKETSPNPKEIESDRLLKERGYGNASGGTPGDRVER